MFSSKMNTATAAALLFGSVYGHAVMNTPTPYGFSDLQTSPLNGQTFQFPCQSGSRADAFNPAGANNPPVAAGDSQVVKFTGSAVHGGGSCQFSVTYENPPPADPSKWKVIHTIIGNCFSATDGNILSIGTDADGRPTGAQCTSDGERDCLKTFNIPIPKQMKSGNATFAWSWFNHIGNREIYMNCAPITITDGSNDDTFFNSLPGMFVANYPGYCTTGQGILDIPNPGKSVEILAPATPGSLGTCGSGTGSSTTPAASSAAAAPAASSPAVFAPGASSAAAAPAPVATSSPAAAAPPAASSTPSSSTPSSSTSADGVACTNEGGVVCMGTGYFGLCDHGYAVKMMVSAGTQCVNGAVVRRAEPRRNLHARRINRSS